MRHHVPVSLSILALAFAGAIQAAEKPAEPIKLEFSWNLSLDAQGHVTQLTSIPNKRADSVPQVRERLEREIRSWPLVSGTVDGRPAPTETYLTVSISLLPYDENSYRIAFDDARTGGRVDKLTLPHYPASAVRERKTGMVVLRVDYDANGKAIAVAPDPSSPQNARALVQASVEAAKLWTFQPERVDGHGVPGTQVLPVCYSVFDMPPRASQMEAACRWNPPGKHAAISQGESLAVDPVAHLARDIAGHAL